MTIDDDGYDRRWSYRAFSSIWTERDVPETGQRLLAVHRVDWHCPRDWPLEGDVIFIEDRQATPCDVGLEAAILDAERIRQARDDQGRMARFLRPFC
jgi:hypothetical protein